MRRYLTALLTLSLLLLLPLPSLAGSCKCTYSTIVDGIPSQAPGYCAAETGKTAADCNNLTPASVQDTYSDCQYCTADSCQSGCVDSGLTQINKSCKVDADCQISPCQNGHALCQSGSCFVDGNLKQCWKNTQSLGGLGPTVEFKAPTTEIKIPGVDFSINKLQVDANGYLTVPYLVEYIKGIYKFLAIAASILAAIVIILNGFRITMSAGGEEKGEGIKRVGQAVIGLFIMWSSYAILYTVNPVLTQLKPLSIKYITPENIELVNPAEFTKATGEAVQPKNTYKSQAEQIAQKAGVTDQCQIETILAIESGGNANAVGHDEHYTGSATVKSRRAFLLSGVTYLGNKFTPPKQSVSDYVPADDNSYDQKNDDGFVNNPPDFGLDWRFSHGFGLGQITLWDTEKFKCNGGRGYTDPTDNTCYSIPDLLKSETALTLAVHHFQKDLAAAQQLGLTGDDLIQAAFYHYNTGKIDQVKMKIATYSVHALEVYQQCKANNNDINMDTASPDVTPDVSDDPSNN